LVKAESPGTQILFTSIRILRNSITYIASKLISKEKAVIVFLFRTISTDDFVGLLAGAGFP
jgi:hypothetical protein